MRHVLRGHPRVMVCTKVIRSPLKRVVADPPTPLGMAVGFAYKGVDADADRTNQCRLSKVRAESRPEIVIDRTVARVDRARVNCRPMAKEVEEHNQQHQASQEEQGQQAEPKLLTGLPSVSRGTNAASLSPGAGCTRGLRKSSSGSNSFSGHLQPV